MRKGKRSPVEVAIAILIAVVVGAIVKYGVQEFYPKARNILSSDESVGAKFEQYADRDVTMSALRENFPDYWQEYKKFLVRDTKSLLSERDVKLRSAQEVRKFFNKNINWTLSASDGEIVSLMRAESRFVDILEIEDVSLCAQHVMTGLRGDESLSERVKSRIPQVALMRIKATRSGRDAPQVRNPPTDSDLSDLVLVMSELGASDEMLNSLATGMAGVGAAQQCQTMKIFYKALLQLPEDKAARIYTMVLREAAANS